MRQSTSSQSEADSRRAAERLKEARDLLAGLRQQQAAGSVDDLARQAEAMANRQQESNAKMRRAFGRRASNRHREPRRNRPKNWRAKKSSWPTTTSAWSRTWERPPAIRGPPTGRCRASCGMRWGRCSRTRSTIGCG
jgi:hypothetical protein